MAATSSLRKITLRRRADETPEQRAMRLRQQAIRNGVRVYDQGDGVYRVLSQQRAAPGQRRAWYDVREFAGLGWGCSCRWAEGHGLYIPGEQDAALCVHIRQTLAHIERETRDIRRVTGQMIARLTTQERARQAYADLYEE